MTAIGGFVGIAVALYVVLAVLYFFALAMPFTTSITDAIVESLLEALKVMLGIVGIIFVFVTISFGVADVVSAL